MLQCGAEKAKLDLGDFQETELCEFSDGDQESKMTTWALKNEIPRNAGIWVGRWLA